MNGDGKSKRGSRAYDFLLGSVIVTVGIGSGFGIAIQSLYLIVIVHAAALRTLFPSMAQLQARRVITTTALLTLASGTCALLFIGQRVRKRDDRTGLTIISAGIGAGLVVVVYWLAIIFL